MMEVLNLPNPNDSCERRDTAAVTPQAFTLFNSDAVTDRAIALAARLTTETDDLASQLQRAFVLTLGRPGTEREIERLSRYVRQMRSHHQTVTPERERYPTEILRSLVEELSGKPFEYVELLRVFKNYESDLKAADVSVETRALADVCLLLLNSNEFVYVY